MKKEKSKNAKGGETLSKRDKNLIYIADELRFLDIVFTHPAVSFKAAPDLTEDVYQMTDSRLYDPSQWGTPESFYDVYFENIRKAIETVKGTIFMPYSPFVATCTDFFIDTFSKLSDRITCLAFFHSAEDITAAYPENYENIINESDAISGHMGNYPFIHKYEIPVDYEIEFRYILHCSLHAIGK